MGIMFYKSAKKDVLKEQEEKLAEKSS